jgi:hypothetical protein
MIDEMKDKIEGTVDDIEAVVLARKAELEIELDAIKDSIGEKAEEAKGFLKTNGRVMGMIAFALVIGFSLGAALV